MTNRVEFIDLEIIKPTQFVVMADTDVLIKLWRANKPYYDGFDRTPYYEPCIQWFEYESAELQNQKPTKFRLPRIISFENNKLHFGNGRNRTHWMFGHGMREIPVQIAFEQLLTQGDANGFITRRLTPNTRVSVPLFYRSQAIDCQARD